MSPCVRHFARWATVLSLILLGCERGDTTPITTAPEGPAPPATTIPLSLVRMDGGSGPALVSSGIPLPPGLLRPAQLQHLRILVNGEEQEIHAEALGGARRDGSVRSVLIQFPYSVPADSAIGAQLVVDPGARRSRGHAKAPPAYSYTAPVPAAVALPSSDEYLRSTDLVGPTTGIYPAFSLTYEQRFVAQSDQRWRLMEREYGSTLGEAAIGRNYYDRAMIHWAWWIRTGEPEYWRRAVYYLMGWRELFMRPNDYATQPFHWQMEGLALHYLLTGDEESRRGVERIAVYFAKGDWYTKIGDRNAGDMEGRVQERVVQSFLAAWLVGLDDEEYSRLLRESLNRILSTQQPDGSYTFAHSCGGSNNFMTGLVNDVLIRYHEVFEADPRITPAIKRSVDWLWDTQWQADAGGFNYYSVHCPGFGGPSAEPDLNLLYVTGFGWTYRQTGDAVYRHRGDTIFREGVARAWFGANAQQADKQFNENYRSSFRYLAYRG